MSTSSPSPYQYRGGQQKSRDEASFDKGPMPIFRTGVREIFVSARSVGQDFVVLPAFDFSQFDSPDFALSFSASHLLEELDGQGNPILSEWYAYVEEYSMFGARKISFLSPKTYDNIPGWEGDPDLKIDPIAEIRSFCRKQPATSEWGQLAKKKVPGFGNREDDYLTKPSSKVIMNAAKVNAASRTIIDESKDVGIIKLSGYGFEEHTLDHIVTPASKQSKNITNDPCGDAFVLGDITNPDNPVIARLTKVPLGASRSEAVCLSFNDGGKVDKYNQKAIMVAKAVSDDVLRSRKPLLSAEVINIPTPQEIVNFLVSDGYFPYDLICEALAPFNLVIPPEPARGAHGEADGDAPARTLPGRAAASSAAPRRAAPAPSQNAAPAAPSSTPPARRSAAAPAASAPSPAPTPSRTNPSLTKVVKREFWITRIGAAEDGSEDVTEKITEEDFLASVALGDYTKDTDLMALAEGSDWVPAHKLIPSLNAPKPAPAKPAAPAGTPPPARRASATPTPVAAKPAAAAPVAAAPVAAAPRRGSSNGAAPVVSKPAPTPAPSAEESALDVNELTPELQGELLEEAGEHEETLNSSERYANAEESAAKARFRFLSYKLLDGTTSFTPEEEIAYSQLCGLFQ